MNCLISLILVVLISSVYSASILSVLKSVEKRSVNEDPDYDQTEEDYQEQYEDLEPLDLYHAENSTTENSTVGNLPRQKKHLQTEAERAERRKGMPFKVVHPTPTPAPKTTTTDEEAKNIFGDDDEEDFMDGKDDQGRGQNNKFNKIFNDGKDGNKTNERPVSHIYSNNPVIINAKGHKNDHDGEDDFDEINDIKRPMNIWGTKNIIIFNSKIYCRTNSILN